MKCCNKRCFSRHFYSRPISNTEIRLDRASAVTNAKTLAGMKYTEDMRRCDIHPDAQTTTLASVFPWHLYFKAKQVPLVATYIMQTCHGYRSEDLCSKHYQLEVCIMREFPWVPWESHGNGKHKLNSWEWEWEWWSGNGRKMGIVVYKKFPL